MNEFFADLGQRWTAAAAARGVSIDAPRLEGEIAAELLELARVTAHTRERRFAPLSCYLAGVAVERLRSGRPALTEAEVVAYLNEVRQSLESLAAPE